MGGVVGAGRAGSSSRGTPPACGEFAGSRVRASFRPSMWGRNLKQAGQPNQNTSTTSTVPGSVSVGCAGCTSAYLPSTSNSEWESAPARPGNTTSRAKRSGERDAYLMGTSDKTACVRVEGLLLHANRRQGLPGAGILTPIQSSLSGQVSRDGRGSLLLRASRPVDSFRHATRCIRVAGYSDERIFEDGSIAHGRLRVCGRLAPSRDALLRSISARRSSTHGRGIRRGSPSSGAMRVATNAG